MANLANTKLCKKTWKNEWNPEYSSESTQRELFSEYQHDQV